MSEARRQSREARRLSRMYLAAVAVVALIGLIWFLVARGQPVSEPSGEPMLEAAEARDGAR